ncbi:hypothetical protein [Rhizobium mongolense]|uniref:Uncharacterized protein n=2 Tax=Rhizobium mongolense TaxID=57676 RepID=A0ABR6IUQ8_9HYPH|nr:hypothetical protein [Rhizobium mongolense]MBB4231535.1 hypothetical protein [Rhizobium mongolense]TVZ64120.1 hypothetical protein BCL32_4324 [Rhizobium mongolense USDA 1844]
MRHALISDIEKRLKCTSCGEKAGKLRFGSKRHTFQFYVGKAEVRAAKATEDRDFELADLLGSLRSIIREKIQELDDEIADQEYEAED